MHVLVTCNYKDRSDEKRPKEVATQFSPLEGFPLPLGAWDGLRYFIVALPEPSI